MNAGKTTEQILANEPWYHGLLPREDMKVLLTAIGDFLVRFTDPKVGEPRKFVLSVYVGGVGDDVIRHFVFQEKNGTFAIDSNWFASIADLLNYHHRTKEPVAKVGPESILIRPIGREPWEKAHADVKLTKKLGEGAFGEVHMGEVRVGNTTKKAAVKLAKLEALTKEQIKEIMHEARLMRKFLHKNVVKFYGVAAGQEPLMVLMELAENGALDSYLKKNAATLTIIKRNEMILQAARGLEYLHSIHVIHRDIASRNCLYGDNQVKIADFGLSREGDSYKLNPHKKIPIRWLAPEVPRIGMYTLKSDVFAYGIMCWEVYHDGEEPYPNMKVAEVLPKVQEGYRMDFKEGVPAEIASFLTNQVTDGDDSRRLSMAEIVQQLPALPRFEVPQNTDSYFDVKKAESEVEVRRAIEFILPQPSEPLGAGTSKPGPVQENVMATSEPQTPNMNKSSDIRSTKKKVNRKPMHKSKESIERHLSMKKNPKKLSAIKKVTSTAASPSPHGASSSEMQTRSKQVKKKKHHKN